MSLGCPGPVYCGLYRVAFDQEEMLQGFNKTKTSAYLTEGRKGKFTT